MYFILIETLLRIHTAAKIPVAEHELKEFLKHAPFRKGGDRHKNKQIVAPAALARPPSSDSASE